MNRFLLKIRALAFCAAAVLGLQLLAGCETLQSNGGSEATNGSANMTAEPQPVVPTGDTSTLVQLGDKLTIQFFDAPLPETEQIVREDGSITLPMNQTVRAAGKTKGELEQAIHNLYVPKFYRRMTVNVKPEERSYFVAGEVRNPGQRVHSGSITVLKAIGAAGDFTDFANRKKIDLFRANGQVIRVNGKEAAKDPNKDLPVYPNDRVYVHRRFF